MHDAHQPLAPSDPLSLLEMTAVSWQLGPSLIHPIVGLQEPTPRHFSLAACPRNDWPGRLVPTEQQPALQTCSSANAVPLSLGVLYCFSAGRMS
ncbi:hypothetical protein CgunFtcFv8_008977 [Champsocephalus gunnari]|uniref:Uncharacterized protein n=1 Tax=Champsocephalus gunnari TaxID=52237 RepID=A0AAN8HGJ2_CHAGU|nr:hypothetical protein CgunFtcFv8_008977 [Champsocephalus gunnari]